MRRRAVRWSMTVCMAALLCGCQDSEQTVKTQESHEERLIKDPVPDMSTAISENLEEIAEDSLPKEVLEEDTSEEVIPVLDVAEVEKEEPMLYLITDYDVLPQDTVKYVVSEEEEIMETRLVESVIDETDPQTFQVIKTEKEVQVTEEVPFEYSDPAGNVKYAYVDGFWYAYQYSTGDITLDEPDEEFALLIMNLDGFYDGYDVFRVEHSEILDDQMGTQHEYHILYRKTSQLEGEPMDTEGLTVSEVRQEISSKVEIVEEKVPIVKEEQFGTDEYIYHGWQKLEDEIYYFDENGDKVTGEQVIRGVRYLFDRHGVKVSDNGIHVSDANGMINWDCVKEYRIDYAVIRAGYRGCGKGELVKDGRFLENVVGARREGIDVGLSIYSQAVTAEEAVEEANFAISLAKEHLISRPLVIVSSQGDPECRGRADALSREDRTKLIKIFCETVRDAGYTPMIHAEKAWIEQCLDAEALKEYPLWLAQYNSNVTYSGPYAAWQYTAKGNLDGIRGNTGLSISR
ncbi:MAG: hypothetical protein IKV59_10385 [Lachnospiraceae bacterium]|nr:hypothetical protein [Lachnospiraceae bacterium]